MYITAIEDLDTHILESLDAMGCTPFQKIRYGVIPQLTASFISTTIYRFDINLKDATTLGIVGAGGIGASLVQCLNSRRWAYGRLLRLGADGAGAHHRDSYPQGYAESLRTARKSIYTPTFWRGGIKI